MFNEEIESQAKRKTITILQDEMHNVLESARRLNKVYESVKNNTKDLEENFSKISKLEDKVESNRRLLTRELSEIGDLVLHREDFLRASYNIEEISGYITSIGFRISHMNFKTLNKVKLDKDFDSLMEMIIEGTYRLNEIIRALAINPHHSLDLTNSIQKLEKEVDTKYRELMPQVINKVESVKELIVIKDVLDSIENGFDQILRTTDSIAILALGL